MSGYADYEDDNEYPEEGAAQHGMRRTRRRRRHKKQGMPDSGYTTVGHASEEYRGRWMPPPSATTLTLAQLGIHVQPKESETASLTLAKLGIHVDPPTMPPRRLAEPGRNVVTWSDLDLVQCHKRSSQAAGDIRPPALHPHQQVSHQPPWVNGASTPYHVPEERPSDRILSVPSPSVALHLPEHMPSLRYAPDPLSPVGYTAASPVHHLQNQQSGWSAENDQGMRQWMQGSQFGPEPVYNSPMASAGGMMVSAPLQTCASPTSSRPAPTGIAAEVAARIAEEDKIAAAKREAAKLEEQKLETLLQSLAADAYQD